MAPSTSRLCRGRAAHSPSTCHARAIPNKLEHRESGLARGDDVGTARPPDDRAPCRALGYAPITFTSSVAALEAFRAHPDRFHAVVTDERMPGLSGSALVRQIRETHADVPIILMSGFVNPDLVARTQDLGVETRCSRNLLGKEISQPLARASWALESTVPARRSQARKPRHSSAATNVGQSDGD